MRFALLALSGGSDYGAFGAGVLVGWTETGTRPEFKLVTGVSTGALTAPLAFIGSSKDPVLREVYTGIGPDQIFRRRDWLSIPFSDSLTDISGDNGGSAEGQIHGTPNEVAFFNGVEIPVERQLPVINDWGSDRTYPNLAVGWTWAFGTPYQWTKQIASHFGGTRNGMAISWPQRIADRGGIRHQFHHVLDIAPTILEAIGIPEPRSVNGVAQRPIEGISMLYTFDAAQARAPSRRRTQHFEMLGHRGIYHDGWFANTTPPTLPWQTSGQLPADVINGYSWELYNLAEDPTQSRNLAAAFPDKLRDMQQRFLIEAARYQVLPMDNSSLPRLIAPRPGPSAGRQEFIYRAPGSGLQTSIAPSLLNRPYRLVAEIEVPQGSANGVIATHGGRFAGWGFYLLAGRPVFTWNLLDIERIRWEAPNALPPGRHSIAFEFQPEASGPPVGRGGTGTLSVNGQVVARQAMARTLPFAVQGDETFDVGLDTGSSVDERDYRTSSLIRHVIGHDPKVIFAAQTSSYRGVI